MNNLKIYIATILVFLSMVSVAKAVSLSQTEALRTIVAVQGQK